jgi:hypothetical protein
MAMLSGFLDVLRGGEGGQSAPQVRVADLIESKAPFREGNLVLCPSTPEEYDHVDLAPEEATSIDVSSFTLDTV